jgi:bacteriophage N4 adsorption protein B
VVSLLEWCFLFSCFCFLIVGADDLCVDAIAWIKRLRPQFLDTNALEKLMLLPEKRVAIIVPAWDEGDLMEHMLRGNIHRLRYQNYCFFVGVYPNDEATCEAVARVSLEFGNVYAVMNSRPGPTSKGQMLNETIAFVQAKGEEQNSPFDVLLMQDAEDILHPLSLKLINSEMEVADFLQTPVFSLPLRFRHWVGGTYMDEFAELHTKDLLVRSHLKAGVPSAGVGTALHWRLVKQILQWRGHLFQEGSLTEDYELGLSCASAGARSRFVCAWYRNSQGEREYIATREFFPKSFWRSVKQKTRWNIGIIFQGTEQLGWRGRFLWRYFLYRDRRGLLTNPLTIFGYTTTLAVATLPAWAPEARGMYESPEHSILLWSTAAIMGNRLFQRALCTARVYGLKTLLSLPLRWPLGAAINACATVRAASHYVQSRWGHRTLVWGKTEHELPDFMKSPLALTNSTQNEGKMCP